jgi:hypothetical protein
MGHCFQRMQHYEEEVWNGAQTSGISIDKLEGLDVGLDILTTLKAALPIERMRTGNFCRVLKLKRGSS